MLKRMLFAVAVLGAAACGTTSYGSGGTTGTTTTTGGGTITGSSGLTVTAQSFSFTPATMTVNAGETVTWRNADTIDHTVTSGTNGQPDGRFDQLIHPGETFSFTFTQPGSYPYYCRFHFSMGMTGMVSVSGGSTTPGTASSTTGSTTTSTSSTTGTSATTGRY